MAPYRTPTVLGPFGRFVIERRLGEGASAIVYQARDRDGGAHVALKLFKHESSEPATLARFGREFTALKSIRHDNLVKLNELFLDAEEDGESFFTMDLVNGPDLVSYVRRDAPESTDRSGAMLLGQPVHDGASSYAPCSPDGIQRLRAALLQLVAGTSAIHAAGLVHRDLRPANVRVTREDRVVILDFGLATHSGTAGSGGSELVGTPAYMAPEQWESAASGPASDWYAVGVILFEALTGGTPFTGNAHEVFIRKRTVGAPHPGLLVGGVPEDLDELCAALLRTSPIARPGPDEILARLAR